MLNPPWLRPSASVSGSPLCPGRVLVRPDHGAVDEVERPIDLPAGIGLLLDGGEQLVPDPSPGPAPEASVRGLPGPVSLGEIAPGCPGSELPQDGIEHAAIVLPGSAGLVRGQERLEPVPLGVGQFVSFGHGWSQRTELSSIQFSQIRRAH